MLGSRSQSSALPLIVGIMGWPVSEDDPPQFEPNPMTVAQFNARTKFKTEAQPNDRAVTVQVRPVIPQGTWNPPAVRHAAR